MENKRFELLANDNEFNKILDKKKLYIEFFENRFEYHAYVVLEVPEINLENDELEVEKWVNEVNHEIVVGYRKFITDFTIKWEPEFKLHMLTICNVSGSVLEIPFKKRTDYEELFEYLKTG